MALHGCGGAGTYFGRLLYPFAAEQGWVVLTLKAKDKCWGGVDMAYIKQVMEETPGLVPGGVNMAHIYGFAFSSGTQVLNQWVMDNWPFWGEVGIKHNPFNFAGIAIAGSAGPPSKLPRPTQFMWANGELEKEKYVTSFQNAIESNLLADGNGCSAGSSTTKTLPRNATHMGAKLTTWQDCDAFTEMWLINGMAHGMPTSRGGVVDFAARAFRVFGAAFRGEPQPGVCKQGVCSPYTEMKNGEYWTE